MLNLEADDSIHAPLPTNVILLVLIGPMVSSIYGSVPPTCRIAHQCKCHAISMFCEGQSVCNRKVAWTKVTVSENVSLTAKLRYRVQPHLDIHVETFLHQTTSETFTGSTDSRSPLSSSESTDVTDVAAKFQPRARAELVILLVPDCSHARKSISVIIGFQGVVRFPNSISKKTRTNPGSWRHWFSFSMKPWW